MVITKDNELYGWGFNGYGDLGLGKTAGQKVATPTKIENIKDIIDISGGQRHFIALNSAGEVYVTGSNSSGQLGNGNTAVERAYEFEKVDLPVKAGTVNAGYVSNAITTIDGNVYAWGGNSHGQLGTGDNINKKVPTQILGVSNIRQVDMGATHSILRDVDNNTYIVGKNDYGQLGIGTLDNKSLYQQNGLISNVIRVSAGNTYTVFVKEDGFVWACGDYNQGNKSLKSKTNSKIPTLVGSDASSLDILEVVIMEGETKSIIANAKFKFNLIYIDENNTSNFKYESLNRQIATVNESGEVLGVKTGTTWVKVIDRSTNKEHVAIIRVVANRQEYTNHVAPKVVTGQNFTLALKENGTAWGWGFDSSCLADTDIPSSSNILATYKDISAGKNHVIALREDGTVWSVGNNIYGQLGIGNNEDKSKFVQIQGLSDIVLIATGENNSLAVDSYGIVYGWGKNNLGELGQETIGKNINTPQIIGMPGEKIMYISAGKDQSVFVTASGTVYGMGKYLNGYIPNLQNAVKAVVSDNYILVLRTDGSVYKYNQYGILMLVGNIFNAVDISSKNGVNMYQTVDEKAYVWGTNTNGQLGLNNNTSTGIPAMPMQNSTNVFSIGAGYNNTYIIANTGFTYASGTNTYGELGNGTSKTEGSITKNGSLVHTLVGDRNFEIVPESNTLELNEIEDITIKANTFNVFEEKEKEACEYEWKVEDASILTVLKDGKIQGIGLGTSNVLVTDKVTNETKKGTRAVVPIDTNRIQTIKADGIQALVVDAYKYEVSVPVEETVSTSELEIITKLGTDEISLDNGATWSKGSINTKVNIPNESNEIPFKVKTEAGNILDYTVTIIRQSKDTTLQTITVTKAGTIAEIPASKVSDKVYEVVVPKEGEHLIKVTTNHIKASVSINGLAKALNEQTYNLTMQNDVETLPIKITSESGITENYTLIVYTEEYATLLDKVYVNGDEANKVNKTIEMTSSSASDEESSEETKQYNIDYEIIIDDEIELSKVKAITTVSTSKVGIDDSNKETKQITKTVQTSDDITIVKIQVESLAGIVTKEYNLAIYKQRTQSKIQTVEVNDIQIQEVNKVYTAYIKSDVEEAKIKITAKDANYYIKLGEYEEEAYTVTKVENISKDTTTYLIKVKDNASGEEEKYTLIIKRGDTEIGVKSIYASNGKTKFTATQVNDYEYEIKIPDTYQNTDLTVACINSKAKVDIDGNGFIAKKNTKNISILEDNIIVPFTIKAEDDGKEQEYIVKIVHVSDDTGINEIKVDELLGLDNICGVQTDSNTYEVTLQHPVKEVNVIANTVSDNAEIRILDDNYAQKETSKQISINSSITELSLMVKSQYGTEKEYTLIINTLPDDIAIASIEVEGETATYNFNTRRYEVKVDNTYSKYNMTVVANDQNATVTIDALAEPKTNIGTTQAVENKAGETTTVPIKVVAQNGINTAEYTLAIIEKSNIASIGMVNVNGTEVLPQDDGNYCIDVVSTTNEAQIYVEASDQYAIVTLDNETTNSNNITIQRNITSEVTIYNIVVVSEDGKSKVEKTLTINRLRGNADLETVTVKVTEGTKAPTLEDEGIYYIKVKRQNSAVVTIKAQDERARISIEDGELAQYTASATIELIDEITTVNAVIEAEDGTELPIIINIEKESDDATLDKLISEDAIKIKYSGNNIYNMQVYDTLQTLTIDAITTNENAKIKLGAESTYTVHELLNKQIDLTTGITSFTINVMSESGETSKTYTVQLTKVYSTKILSVTTDGENCTKKDNIYTGWIDNDDTANIVITPDNLNAKVSLYKGEDLVSSATGVLTLQDTVTTGAQSYKIVVSGDKGELSEYELNVTKKSTNNNVGYVKVNGETLTQNTENVETLGNYNVEVANSPNDEYTLEILAQEEHATIKLAQVDNENGDSLDGNFVYGGYSDTNLISKTFTILPGETKEVKFVVKSQNGEESSEKLVKINRKDNNIDIEYVKVNGIDITSRYDDVNKEYEIILDNTLEETDLEVKVKESKTSIETTIDDNYYNQVGRLFIKNITVPRRGRKEIIFTITAEDGTEETRTIAILQFASNIELEEVKVNNIVATKREDKNYEVEIDDGRCLNGIAQIYAKAVEETSYIAINENELELGSSTINLENITSGTTIEVPIRVKSADEHEYTYKLYITVKSGDNRLEYVKVNNNDAEKVSKTEYRMFVDENATDCLVDIKALYPQAIVKTTIIGTDGNNIEGNTVNFTQTLTDVVTKVKFTIAPELGEEQEYTLDIIKASNDNTIKNVYVNGEEIQKDTATGRYSVKIYEGDENPTVKVVTNNEFAHIRIGVSTEGIGVKEETIIHGNARLTTVPITVKSQAGGTNVEYLDIEVIYTTSRLDTVIVDGKEVTTYDENTKTYTAIVRGDINPHEVFIMSENSYSTLQINEDMGIGNIETSIQLENEEIQKTTKLIVTPESGEPEEYYITLIIASKNTKISELYVNDIELQPDENNKDIYRKSIKKKDDKVKVKVIAENPYANVKIGDCTPQIAASEVLLDIDLLEDYITIPVLITATDGETIATYNIILSRLSDNTEITISYDNAEVVKDEQGKYIVRILDTITSGVIDVTTNDDNAKVDIANSTEYKPKTKQYNLIIDPQTEGRTIEVPISVIAEDGTQEDMVLNIIRISTDNCTEKIEGIYNIEVTENGEETTNTITKEATLENEIYTIEVPENIPEMLLKITAKSEYATIKRVTKTGSNTGVGTLETGVELNDNVTYVTYEVVAEAGGEPQTGTVKIVKQSINNSIDTIVVDGKQISIGEDGIYHASVIAEQTKANVIVTSSDDKATIKLEGNTNVGLLNTDVDVKNTKNIYKIKVTSESGAEKEYTLEITVQTNIYGKITTDNVNGKHKAQVIVYKTADTRPEDKEISQGIKEYNPQDTAVREVIVKQETNDDGTFVIEITNIEQYDIVITKQGYLDYRVTDISMKQGKISKVPEYKLIAGDVVKTGEIELDDLVAIGDNYGEVTENNKSQKAKYDLNEDGVVNKLDRNILKGNYTKKAETVQWVDPDAKVVTSNNLGQNTVQSNSVNENVAKNNSVNKSVDKSVVSSNSLKSNSVASSNGVVASNSQTQTETKTQSETKTQTKVDSNTLMLPIACKYVITSPYGYRVHPTTGEKKLHSGIDISGTHHTEVFAVTNGEVTYAGVQSGYGNCIEIKHVVNGETIYSFYAHLSKINVTKGQKVSKGDVIALEGGDPTKDQNPGTSTGHHLHFEIRSTSGSGHSIDPNKYIKF